MEVSKPETKDELVQFFINCVNCAEPEHPYLTEPYPIERDDLYLGWSRSDGPYIAKCGPRNGSNTVGFFPDVDSLLNMNFPYLMAVMTHEISHITEGKHTAGATHNKAFWRAMAFNAWQLRENSPYIGAGGLVTEEAYVIEVVEEPNSFTVDRRIETVAERKQEMKELLGVE